MTRQIVYFLLFATAVVLVEGHRRGGKIPPSDRAPFLKGLNQTHYDEYHKIIHNQNLTKKQFHDAVDAFAENLPAENQV